MRYDCTDTLMHTVPRKVDVFSSVTGRTMPFLLTFVIYQQLLHLNVVSRLTIMPPVHPSDRWDWRHYVFRLSICHLLCTHIFAFSALLSVLWHCWFGGRKGIQPVKKLSGGVLVWLSAWSEVQTCICPSWCHCHALSLASVKSRLVLPFWYQPTQVVPDRGP